MPQVSGSVQGNYPFWERGGRFVIQTVGGGSGFGGEGSTEPGSIIPWPVSLMRRVVSFKYEEDEMKPSKLTLVLDNSDYALTELTRDPTRDAADAVGQTSALMGPGSAQENVYVAYGNPSQIPADEQRFPFVGQVHRLEYRHLFELGTTLAVQYGYGEPAMSPTRVIRVAKLTGWSEITVEAYEVHFAFGALYRTANWTLTRGGGLQAISSSPVIANVFAEVGVQFKTRSSADGVRLDEPLGNPFAVHTSGTEAVDLTTLTGSAGSPNAVGASGPRSAAAAVASNREPEIAASATESTTTPSVPQREGHAVGIYLGDRYARYYPEGTGGTTPASSVPADGFEGRPLIFEEDGQGYPHVGVVSTIARRYGFRAVVEERYIEIDNALREIRYQYAQVNINDMAFLQQSAVWMGYAFWVELAPDFLDLKLNGNPNKKPLGTFFFMPRMYWQQPYATYVWGMEIDQSKPILPSGAVYDRPGDVAILFDRIVEFDEPSIDSRQKSTLFSGSDINPLTGREYSAKNAIQQGFKFRKLGLDWYDFNAIQQGFDEQAFNRVRDSGSSSGSTPGSSGVPPTGRILNATELATEMAKPVDQMDVDLIVRSLEGITLEQEPFVFGLNTNVPAFQDATPYDQQFHEHQAEAETGQSGGLSGAREERLRRLLIFRAQQEGKQEDDVAKILLNAQAALDALAQRRPGINGSAASMRGATAELWSLIERFTGDFMNDLEGTMTSRITVIGDPFLQARRVLKTQGVGVYSGLWYAKSVTHTIDNSGYMAQADLMTNRIPDNTRKFRRSSLESELNKYDVGITEARLNIQAVIDRANVITSQLEDAIQQDTAAAAAAADEERRRRALYHDSGAVVDLVALGVSGGSDQFRPRFAMTASAANPAGSFASWEDWKPSSDILKSLPCAVLKILENWAKVIRDHQVDIDAVGDGEWFTSPTDPNLFDRGLVSRGQGGISTNGLIDRAVAFMYYLAFLGWHVGYGGSGPVSRTQFGEAATNNVWSPETWTTDGGRLRILQSMAFVTDGMRSRHFARTHEFNGIFNAITNLPARPNCGEQEASALPPATRRGATDDSTAVTSTNQPIPWQVDPPHEAWARGSIGVVRVNSGDFYLLSYSGGLDNPGGLRVNAWTRAGELSELRDRTIRVANGRTVYGRGVGNRKLKPTENWTEDTSVSYEIGQVNLPSQPLD